MVWIGVINMNVILSDEDMKLLEKLDNNYTLGQGNTLVIDGL